MKPAYPHILSGFSILAVVALIAVRGICTAEYPQGETPRPSILAGTWYPKDPRELQRMISGFLQEASPPSAAAPPGAILVPHAGYRYSGAVAAKAYRWIKGHPYTRVILVGPSHRKRFDGVSVNLQAGYRTPLGTVAVDRALGRRALSRSPLVRWLPEVHALEHSLEIQLPFLQSVLGGFRIVPIVMGQQDWGTCCELARLLVHMGASDDKTLLLASTDLSHFHRADVAEPLDKVFIRHVRAFDPRALSLALDRGQCEACGGGAALAVMMAARQLGAEGARILEYAHSGRVTGDGRRVVGYLSAVFLPGE